MNKLTKTVVAIATLIFASASVASTLSIPNTFSSGDATSAAEMNSNFSAVKAAVDDNDTRITALEGGSSAPVFQGFSSGTVDGSGGIRGMQAACDTSFSGSKICTSAEFTSSTYKQVSLSGTAWLLPVLQPTSAGVENSSSGTDGFVTDQGSGYTANNNNPERVFTCSAYSDTRQSGLTVSSTGGFASESCDTARPVACCK